MFWWIAFFLRLLLVTYISNPLEVFLPGRHYIGSYTILFPLYWSLKFRFSDFHPSQHWLTRILFYIKTKKAYKTRKHTEFIQWFDPCKKKPQVSLMIPSAFCLRRLSQPLSKKYRVTLVLWDEKTKLELWEEQGSWRPQDTVLKGAEQKEDSNCLLRIPWDVIWMMARACLRWHLKGCLRTVDGTEATEPSTHPWPGKKQFSTKLTKKKKKKPLRIQESVSRVHLRLWPS